MIARLFRQLRRDQQGVSVVEFALLAPVLLTMLMGLMDLAYNMYTAQMLQGAVQAAARKSTIEGASTNSAAIDGVVTTAVHAVAPAGGVAVIAVNGAPAGRLCDVAARVGPHVRRAAAALNRFHQRDVGLFHEQIRLRQSADRRQ